MDVDGVNLVVFALCICWERKLYEQHPFYRYFTFFIYLKVSSPSLTLYFYGFFYPGAGGTSVVLPQLLITGI